MILEVLYIFCHDNGSLAHFSRVLAVTELCVSRTQCAWDITSNHRKTGVNFVALVNRF